MSMMKFEVRGKSLMSFRKSPDGWAAEWEFDSLFTNNIEESALSFISDALIRMGGARKVWCDRVRDQGVFRVFAVME